MTTLSTLIDAIKAKFEGGTSFTVDWNRIAREGAQATLQNIAPQLLYREQPIYGGVIDGITVYYCPTEVAAPKGIYDNVKRLTYNFVPPNVFEYLISRHDDSLIFTIVYKNGARFILINASCSTSSLTTIDEMDSLSTVTGDMALTLNTYDFVSGAGAIQGIFTNANTTIRSTLATPIDISQSLFGTLVLPIEFLDPSAIASISFKLKTDNANYYTLTATDAFAYLIQGWNTVRMNMTEAVATGTPVPTNITAWELVIVLTSGKTQLIKVDRIALALTSLYRLQFISGLIFVDATTGTRKVQPSDPLDLIALTDEEVEILKYECCRITCQEASLQMQNSPESSRFDTELGRKYAKYFEKNPSSEQPVSYNNMPEIDRTIPLGNILPR